MAKPFIRKVPTASGATAVQVIFKRGSDIVRLEHIGSAHNSLELKLLIAKANAKLEEMQPKLNLFPPSDAGAFIEKTYSELLWKTLCDQYSDLGFDSIRDEVFKQLVLARIIEPTSKMDTIRVLTELGLDAPSNTDIHRCLKRIVADNYRSVASACCFRHTSPKSLSLLLYDVTTLYFEIQREDDFRKPGMSKERRLEPQITVGLLVDRDGFPLEIQSFEGNRAEVKTIMEVLDNFKTRYSLNEITVCADAAMLSSGIVF